MKKLKIILSALIISIAACSAASAETVVRLLVNRNGIKNSVRIDRFVEMKKGYTVSLKDKNLGKLSADGMKYTTTDHGVNQIFIYDENNRKKETITVVSYKWIAHRGYSGQYVENTVKAIREAAKAGAFGVEIDVRLSKDGTPFAFHDEDFNVKTNDSGKTDFKYDYSYIKSKIKYMRKPDENSFKYGQIERTGKSNIIPTFDECVNACKKNKLDVCVDIHKRTGTNAEKEYAKIAKATATVIEKYGMKDRTLTQNLGGSPKLRELLGITRRTGKEAYIGGEFPPETGWFFDDMIGGKKISRHVDLEMASPVYEK